MFASCITRIQLCNWMVAVCAAAPLALANQLPLPRLYSALVRSSRKLRYIRIRPIPLRTRFYISAEINVQFLPRDAMLARYMLSSCVCLSVCLSVTSRNCTKMAKRRVMQTTPHNIAQGLQFSDAKDLGKISMRSPQTGAPNTGWAG